jgi:hypothetical protein
VTTTQIVILVLVLLVVAAVVAALVAQSRKRNRLKSTFGPEYDRTVEGSGKRREAERELAEREERRRSLDIRPLAEQDRVAFSDRWRSTQADFVDHPEMAVRQADLLVAEVMGKRGYPVGDFDQMSRDVSVDHAHVVDEYRAAHQISELNDRKQATTEQLRQAMVHYRALFTDLLGDGGSSTSAPRHTSYDGARDDSTSRRDDAGHRDDSGHRDDATYRDDSVRRDDGVRRDDAPYAGERTTTRDAYATDEDRRFEPIDTSRADGVRVERGGLGRGRGGTEFDHDLPRDDRPRT